MEILFIVWIVFWFVTGYICTKIYIYKREMKQMTDYMVKNHISLYGLQNKADESK